MTKAIPAMTVSESTEVGAWAMARNRAVTAAAARSHQLAPSQRLTTEMLTNLNVPAFFGWHTRWPPANRPTPHRVEEEENSISLNYVVRRQLTRMRARLDLDGRVLHVMACAQLPAHVGHEPVAGMPAGNDQVHGKRGLGGAHRPDVQVVHFGDPREHRQVGAHHARIDVLGDRVQRERDRIAQQAPGAP